MKKIISRLLLILFTLVALVGCAEKQEENALPDVVVHTYVEPDVAIKKNIRKVNSFADIPEDYAYFDYKAKALALDKVVFGFAKEEDAVLPSYSPSDYSTWSPIGFWVDQPRQPEKYEPLVTGYLKRSFGLPTYVGDNRVQSSGSEPITTVLRG